MPYTNIILSDKDLPNDDELDMFIKALIKNFNAIDEQEQKIKEQEFIKLSEPDKEFPIYLFSKREEDEYKVHVIEGFQQAYILANSEYYHKAFPLNPTKVYKVEEKMNKSQIQDGDVVQASHILELLKNEKMFEFNNKPIFIDLNPIVEMIEDKKLSSLLKAEAITSFILGNLP